MELVDISKPKTKLKPDNTEEIISNGWKVKGFNGADGGHYERMRKGKQERWLKLIYDDDIE